MSTTQLATQVGYIGPGSAGIRMTPAEFDRIEDYDECYRYELVDGVLVSTEVPPESQADANESLGYCFYDYRTRHPQGAVLDLTLPERFIYLPNSRRIADRVIWCGLGRLPDPKNELPAIAVEFVSAGTRNWKRDYITKRDEYLAAGVREYWIIDRFERKMTVYRASGEQPEIVEIGENDTYQTDLLPGFKLPLVDILAAADRWEE